MKYYIDLSGKTTECKVFARPTLQIKANGYHTWDVFKMMLIEPCDIVKESPNKFSVLTVDDEGYMIEKWTLNNTEFTVKNSIILVKFGFATINY